MAEQSLEKTGPDLKSEDLHVEEAADIIDSDELIKPDNDSCVLNSELEKEEIWQAATEEDNVNMENAPEQPEEESSVIDDLPVSDDFKEDHAPDKKKQEALESKVEGDHSQATDSHPEMAEQSLEETGPDLKSEEPNMEEAANATDSDELIKPDDESYAVDSEVEVEKEENEDNTEEEPEEVFEALEIDDVPVSDDFKEDHAPEEYKKETESEVEGDHSQGTANLQHIRLASEDEQELLQELKQEHEKLSQLNHQLQKKLAKCFWLKSGIELQLKQEKILTNEECCQKYPDILEDIRRQREVNKQKHLQQRLVDDLHRQNDEKLEQIEAEWNMLVSAKREVVIMDLEQAKGKREAQAVVERLLTAVQKCEHEFVSVRDENFKLNLKMPKLDAGLHIREEDLDEEMQRIDFEQLKIENQTYSEKIQECQEDLVKLKKIIPQTGQILMHVKEKLRFVLGENQAKRVRFDELDTLLLHEHEALTHTMQARDILRFDNLAKRQECGLLGNRTLLRDLEDTEDEREALERRVEILKKRC